MDHPQPHMNQMELNERKRVLEAELELLVNEKEQVMKAIKEEREIVHKRLKGDILYEDVEVRELETMLHESRQELDDSIKRKEKVFHDRINNYYRSDSKFVQREVSQVNAKIVANIDSLKIIGSLVKEMAARARKVNVSTQTEFDDKDEEDIMILDCVQPSTSKQVTETIELSSDSDSEEPDSVAATIKKVARGKKKKKGKRKSCSKKENDEKKCSHKKKKNKSTPSPRSTNGGPAATGLNNDHDDDDLSSKVEAMIKEKDERDRAARAKKS